MKGSAPIWVAGYFYLCCQLLFLNADTCFAGICFSAVERSTQKILIRNAFVLPYFPYQLPLILMLTLLFIYPTYLLGVPSLAGENLPASEIDYIRSDGNSAPKLRLLYVFLFSQSHAWCIAQAQHNVCSLFISCSTGTKVKAEGWTHKGISRLEGMVTLLSAKPRFVTPPCNCQLTGFHRDLP